MYGQNSLSLWLTLYIFHLHETARKCLYYQQYFIDFLGATVFSEDHYLLVTALDICASPTLVILI